MWKSIVLISLAACGSGPGAKGPSQPACPDVAGVWYATVGLDGSKTAELTLSGTLCDFTVGEGARPIGAGLGSASSLSLDMPYEEVRATCDGAYDAATRTIATNCTATDAAGAPVTYPLTLARDAPPTPPTPPPTEAPTNVSTGVPACDAYLAVFEKLAACDTAGPALDGLRQGLEATKQSWATWHDLPEDQRSAAQEAAVPGCKAGEDALRSTAASLGCAI